MKYSAFAALIFAAAPASSGGLVRAGAMAVPLAPILPGAPLMVPAAPTSLSGTPAIGLPTLSPVLPALVRPSAGLALPAVAVPARAMNAVAAAAEAAPHAAGAAIPVGKTLKKAARAVAAAEQRGAPASDMRGPASAGRARAVTFFDGGQAIPDLVGPEAMAGFLHELQGPARQLRERGVRGTVTVYGSARLQPEADAKKALDEAVRRYGETPTTRAGRKAVSEAREHLRGARYYEEARRFGALVAERGGGKLAVVTGGGPGIMEAANRGALEAGGPSVGYNITLPREQSVNRYVTPGLDFEFENFTTRKMNLRHGAVALVYFPGGFGTMDELFEVLTLVQTGKMPRVPIVLVGERNYWKKVVDFKAFVRMGLISEKDLSLFRFVETADQAWSAVESHYTR